MVDLLNILKKWQDITMTDDKIIELNRYDSRARDILAEGQSSVGSSVQFGSKACPPVLAAPYIYFEECIRKNISHNHDVLELGSGTGMHTFALAQTAARVVASDISSNSLAVLAQRITGINTCVADMESLPFENASFDVVTSAGSLSYGEPTLVDTEIRRVLRPGGTFICVDSLNHSPVYRLNRWFHYKRGERTRSTMLHMPTMERIETISKGFKQTDVRYFGSISFLMPVLARIVGQTRAAAVSDYVDKLVNVRRAAFKFVLVAKGRK